MTPGLDPGEELRFEASARGWPPALPAWGWYGLLLALAALAGCVFPLRVTLGAVSFTAPLVVPVLVLVLGLELARLARWRNRTILITDRRILVLGGQLRPCVLSALGRDLGDRVAGEHLLTPGAEPLSLAGFDALDRESLSLALSGPRAGAPEAGPELPPRRRRGLGALALTLVLAATGLVELRSWRVRAAQAELVRLGGLAQAAMSQAKLTAAAGLRASYLARVDDLEAIDAAERAARRAGAVHAGYALEGRNSTLSLPWQGSFEAYLQLAAPRLEGQGLEPRAGALVRCSWTSALVPGWPTVTVTGTGWPEDALLTDELVRLLRAAGVEVREGGVGGGE